MSTPKKSPKPPAAAKRDRSSMINPNKKTREAAKREADAAIAKMRAKQAAKAPAAPPAITTPAAAVRALVSPPEDEPAPFHLEKPGDPEPYVLTLRITRGHARKLRLVAAYLGHQFPAQWVIALMEREMRKELAEIAKGGGRT